MILLYHKIYPEAKTIWWVTPNAFYLQMADLKSKKVVYLDDYDPADPDQCVITFDGVYENLWKYAVPILQHFNYPFELFVVGDLIGKGNEFDNIEPFSPFASRETLLKMVRAGGRLQWHTRSHPTLVGEHSEEEYRHELAVPEYIRALNPEGFNWFAYPHGQRSKNLTSQTRKYFKGGLSCDDGDPGDLFNLRRTTIYEDSRLNSSTVSLIIPCFNYGHLVAEAIESVLYQIYPPKEIVFIDDASSDNSVEIARQYEPRIRVEVNENNLGIVQNFRKAVDMTTGDYICFLGADNRFRSDYVERTKATLDSNPEVAIAYTHFALFDKRAAIIASDMNAEPHPSFPEIFLKRFPAHPTQNIRELNYIHGSSMYRRVAYHEAGGYAMGNLPEDASLFARILDIGWKAKLVDAYLLEYRQHSKEQANIGKTLELQNAYYGRRVRELTSQVHDMALQIQDLYHEINIHTGHVQELSRQLREIVSSRAWKVAMVIDKIQTILIPPGSFRAQVMGKVFAFLLIPYEIYQNREMNSMIRLIERSGYFDHEWYLSNYPDVSESGLNPASHFLLCGGQEGKSPGPNFSSKAYMETYPDIQARKLNPLVHYLMHGKLEGRRIRPHEPTANNNLVQV